MKTTFFFSTESQSSKRDTFYLDGSQERLTMRKQLTILNLIIKLAKLQFKTLNLQNYLKLPPFELNK